MPTVSTGSDDVAIVSASLSDVGLTRSENQDACGEFRTEAGERLWIVADGMGGHRGGATASRMCIEAVERAFTEEPGPPEERIRLGLERANEAIRAESSRDPELEGMGTTAVAVVLTARPQGWVVWVGDSRAYRYRSGRMEPLSQDHSIVGEWVRLGIMTEEEAEAHPRRHELTRALGVQEVLEVEIRPVDVRPGDRFLLCSDGLCGYMTDAEIAAVLGYESPGDAVRCLVDKVKDESGAPDNVTVQIVCIPEQGDTQEVVTRPPRPADAREGARRPRWQRIEYLAGAFLLALVALAGAGYYGLRVGGGGLPVPEQRRRAQEEASERALALALEEQRSQDRLRGIDERKHAAEERRRRADQRLVEREAERRTKQAQAESATRQQLARAEAERRAGEAPPSVRAGNVPEPKPAVAAKDVGPQTGAPESPPAVPPVGSKNVRPTPPAPEPSAGPAETQGVSSKDPPDSALSATDPKAVPIEPRLAGPDLEAAIRRFLASWTEALNTGNYPLYESLGLSQSKEQFEQEQAELAGAAVSFELLRHKRWVGRFVTVRLRRISTAAEPREQEMVLRETSSGLRYAGDR